MKTRPHPKSVEQMRSLIEKNQSLKQLFKDGKITPKKFYSEFNFEKSISRLEFGIIINNNNGDFKKGVIVKKDGNLDWKTSIPYGEESLITMYKTRYFLIDGELVINHANIWFRNSATFNKNNIDIMNNVEQLFNILYDIDGIRMIANISPYYEKKIKSTFYSVINYRLPKSLINVAMDAI